MITLQQHHQTGHSSRLTRLLPLCLPQIQAHRRLQSFLLLNFCLGNVHHKLCSTIRRIRSKVSQGLELELAKGTEQELSKNRALEQLQLSLHLHKRQQLYPLVCNTTCSLGLALVGQLIINTCTQLIGVFHNRVLEGRSLQFGSQFREFLFLV